MGGVYVMYLENAASQVHICHSGKTNRTCTHPCRAALYITVSEAALCPDGSW